MKAGEITEEELAEIGLKHGAPPVQLSGNCHHSSQIFKYPNYGAGTIIQLVGSSSENLNLKSSNYDLYSVKSFFKF